jgi:NADH-quinone oxidoreductase subunit E
MDSCEEVALDLEPLDGILTSLGDVNDDALIPVLQKIQKSYGYLPPKVLTEMSDRTGIPASRVFGVATFYEQFHLTPHGRYTIRCCRGTACHVRGGKKIIQAIMRNLDLEEGGTTDDMRFTFETVACLGTCFLAPAMMVNNDYYGHLTANKIKSILKSYS